MRSVAFVVACLAFAGQGFRVRDNARPHPHSLAESDAIKLPLSSKRVRGANTLKALLSLFAALSNPAAGLPVSPIGSTGVGGAWPRGWPRQKQSGDGKKIGSKLSKEETPETRENSGSADSDNPFAAALGRFSFQLPRGGDLHFSHAHAKEDALHRIVRSKCGFLEEVYQQYEPHKCRPGESTTYCVQQTQGMGDCLFHAIAIGMAFEDEGRHLDMYDPSLAQRVMDLRQMAVDTLTDDPRRKLHLEGRQTIATGKLVGEAAHKYGMTPQAYCNAMRQSGVWGGGPEILALANALQRPICVFEPMPVRHGPQWHWEMQLCCAAGAGRFDSEKRICICFVDGRFPNCHPSEMQEGNHFVAMLPTYGHVFPKKLVHMSSHEGHGRMSDDRVSHDRMSHYR
mmetsp:Transcript_84624/g.155114  ORF Transcript_84624/g.155114 Transcript_84624/m.155114 type:complete len:398 (-) Transcript_84624:33-1226(-)